MTTGTITILAVGHVWYCGKGAKFDMVLPKSDDLSTGHVEMREEATFSS